MAPGGRVAGRTRRSPPAARGRFVSRHATAHRLRMRVRARRVYGRTEPPGRRREESAGALVRDEPSRRGRRSSFCSSVRAWVPTAIHLGFTLKTLSKGDDGDYGSYYSLSSLGDDRIDKLPYTIRVLLESVIRNCDGFQITKEDVEKIINWEKTCQEKVEIPFKTACVILQDFTGVPVLVDLASMRDAMSKLGGDPDRINPIVPADVVIDHSVTADVVRSENALQANMELEFQMNNERFACLKWGSSAFHNMLIIPPGSGIVHQMKRKNILGFFYIFDLTLCSS